LAFEEFHSNRAQLDKIWLFTLYSDDDLQIVQEGTAYVSLLIPFIISIFLLIITLIIIIDNLITRDLNDLYWNKELYIFSFIIIFIRYFYAGRRFLKMIRNVQKNQKLNISV